MIEIWIKINEIVGLMVEGQERSIIELKLMLIRHDFRQLVDGGESLREEIEKAAWVFLCL